MSKESYPDHRSWQHADPELSTSLTLLSLIKARDDDAWRQLVVQYGPLIHQWCVDDGVVAQDAPDVVQEVLRAVARAVGGFHRDQQGDGFRKWLRRITKRKALDYFRRKRNRPSASGGTTAFLRIQQEHDPTSDESSLDGRSTRAILAHSGSAVPRALLEKIRARVKAPTWEAFWLTVVEEREPAAVAAQLGISLGSVYQARSRILARLRSELAQSDVTLTAVDKERVETPRAER